MRSIKYTMLVISINVLLCPLVSLLVLSGEPRLIVILLFYYARQLYRQVLLRARISYGISVRPSVCLSVRHDPVVYQAQVR